MQVTVKRKSNHVTKWVHFICKTKTFPSFTKFRTVILEIDLISKNFNDNFYSKNEQFQNVDGSNM